MKEFLTLFLCLFISQAAFADQSADDKYHQITRVEHFAIDGNLAEPVLLSTQTNFDQPVSKYIERPVTMDVGLDDLINIGQWLWQIVEDNKPTVNFTAKKATAIPEKAQHPKNMEHWQAPTARTYILIFKNGFGSEVVRFKYKVIFSPKGTYRGKGQYLANTSIHPVEIDVSWGFDFNAEVVIEDVLNLSSNEDPTAGIQMALKWDVESFTKYIEGQEIFFVQGDGDSKKL